MKRTYKSWLEGDFTSIQKEYTDPTPLLKDDGTLLAAGWARHNVFDYDRRLVKHQMRRKEWDFYQIANGEYMAQISFANISLGGYASAVLVNLKTGVVEASVMSPFLGGKDKYVLPPKGDEECALSLRVGKALFETETFFDRRDIRFEMGEVKCHFTMDIMPGLENITTVLPFENKADRYFCTTKQNSMPVEGYFAASGKTVEFKKDRAFCVMDWGRVCTPYSLVWYWGNGSTYIDDAAGIRHIFGFEITWGIGDESNATETAVFYDGKLHKIGPVDVETFPKPDGYMKPWHFISQDGRFDMVMKPFTDHHSDLNILVMRMHSHQVHGLWSGSVILDDGTKLEIRDMYAFCEYVENRW
ncbi:MAG: DUF2804 domain-containing protein [Lachnospiraceae bacterium]|nr:DUF2804 domain-containing protein [Lachnospiraceae bacterium]